MKRWAAALIVASALSACGGRPHAGAADSAAGSGQELTVRELARGEQGGPAGPLERLVTTAAGLDTIWPGGGSPPPVDFRRERVIVVGLGQRRTAGYSVAVTHVQMVDDTLHVRYVESRPGLGCVVAQVVTAPYQVVAVESGADAARFERRVETRSC